MLRGFWGDGILGVNPIGGVQPGSGSFGIYKKGFERFGSMGS